MALYCANLCHSLPEAATCSESDTSYQFSIFLCRCNDQTADKTSVGNNLKTTRRKKIETAVHEFAGSLEPTTIYRNEQWYIGTNGETA
ncbi:hypothetical protein [Bacteroides sp. AF16-49]|uniref:hypothetical protein n=1 Tax=Bacteroides sp. AF16-49 TaxID=2292192 RepID=UPI000F007F31|nr:hypothetical protein [Bacteroides sp. AF16-49]